VVSGRHRGRPFFLFDYVHRRAADLPDRTLLVYAVELPVRVPYLYVQDRDGGAHGLYAESPDSEFAVELLSEGVREDIRRHGITDLVLDGDRLICAGADPGTTDPARRLDALVELVGHVPADVWSRWGR
jgi:hypothetical protein